MSTDQYNMSLELSVARGAEDDLRWAQKMRQAHDSQFPHLDEQERNERWKQLRQDLLSRVSAMGSQHDSHPDVGGRRGTIPSLHCDLSATIESGTISSGARQGYIPYGDQQFQVPFDRMTGTQEASPRKSLRLPLPHHHKRSSNSSTGTGHYSVVSDRPLDPQEFPPSLRLFACLLGKRPVGTEIVATMDTGHTAGASLLLERVARDAGWKPDLAAEEQAHNNFESDLEENQLRVVNGTRLRRLARVELEVDFLDDSDRCHLKKTITFHIVPNDSFEEDCLLNWKLFSRYEKLRLQFLEQLPIVSSDGSRRRSLAPSVPHM